ncbi:Amn1p NDAI_0C05320 [Naumovozyma dairenensis CBS 421]|uniref:Antagonist of mitotic exit network protein 1 n=1 Tax=Naumovozyma dairenensis (strain ATCC 10597 / BCRC 20456 / CBS 421 / NBRC 0211 / NRRL Y-12639) TaxID=1071378 RepID=G0W8T0_NAUDC|nr:hypothetical protein NDAI_0C05320 [Naumovozyma dairenensis CBS 421]CCD24191.1 hypothetical protein NDAI_0C05320 [Naumovozyma dairenensis CBS 421]
MKFLSITKHSSKKRLHESQIPDEYSQRPTKRLSQGSDQLKPDSNIFTTNSNDSVKQFTHSPHSSSKGSKISITKHKNANLSLKTNVSQTSTVNLGQNIFLPTPISTPTKANILYDACGEQQVQFYSTSSPDNNLDTKKRLVTRFSSLNLNSLQIAPHPIFEIPEIVDNIIYFLSKKNNHSNMSAGVTKQQIRKVSVSSLSQHQNNNNITKRIISSPLPFASSTVSIEGSFKDNHLFNCLFINKLWFQMTLPYLLKNIHFQNDSNIKKFINISGKISNITSTTIETIKFHKIHKLKQSELQKFPHNLLSSNIKSIEFYICPNIIPPTSWYPILQNLENLIIPGNKRLNDQQLVKLSNHIPNLETLDLRACENISDIGVVSIALRCPKLKLCNLGRHKNNHLITNVSLLGLGKYTNVETIGFAGCNINDSGIWEFAKLNGANIKRLSLNNCNQLTDYSIPILVGFNYFPNLAVLEIKGLSLINDVRWLVKFKLWKTSLRSPILIEGGDRINDLMKEEENKLKKLNSFIALQELSTWVNADDDDDANDK